MNDGTKGPSRRSLLWAAPALLALAAMDRAADTVSLDWGLSETLFALRVPVLAAADIPGYARVVKEPPTPPGVRNLGLWSAPNLELLQSLSPSLMLIQSWQAPLLPLLRQIGPVEIASLYTRSGSPYQHALTATRQIADRLSLRAQAEDFIGQSEACLRELRESLRPVAGRPVLVVKPLAGALFMAFGSTSLFQGALDRLGLTNAWTEHAGLLAGASVLDIATLAARCGDAQLLMIGGADPAATQPLFGSRLWQGLPFVRAGRVAHLPPFWEFGALPTAFRFAAAAAISLSRAEQA